VISFLSIQQKDLYHSWIWFVLPLPRIMTSLCRHLKAIQFQVVGPPKLFFYFKLFLQTLTHLPAVPSPSAGGCLAGSSATVVVLSDLLSYQKSISVAEVPSRAENATEAPATTTIVSVAAAIPTSAADVPHQNYASVSNCSSYSAAATSAACAAAGDEERESRFLQVFHVCSSVWQPYGNSVRQAGFLHCD
jgi:hypothetical protein